MLSLSPLSKEIQVKGLFHSSVIALIAVVFPNPAGAETSVSFFDKSPANFARNFGLGTKFLRDTGM